MPLYTLGQAAKATGRSKAGLLNDAIRGGRISASRDEKNQWQIDPSELHRFYPLTVQPCVKSEHEKTPLNTSDLTHFHEKSVFLERIIAELENERDDLRHRLDKESEERREAQTKLTGLLTHQPEPKAASISPTLIKRSFAGTRVHVLAVIAILTTCTAVLVWIWLNNH
jgi:hypothetical protein